MASIYYLPVIFLIYVLLLYLLAFHYDDESSFQYLPSSIDDLADFSTNIVEYKNKNPVYVFILFSLAYIWKQSFSIPGSFLLNLLAGSLYGVKGGLPLACLLTAIGATNCYLLSKYFAKDYVLYYFKDKVEAVSAKLNDEETSLLTCLISFRLIPMTPNWLLNICFPILNVPIHTFFLSVLIGLAPYNFVVVHAGTVLSEIHSTADVLDAWTLAKLFLVAILFLVPTLITKLNKRNKKVA